jgi:hypothetical protein
MLNLKFILLAGVSTLVAAQEFNGNPLPPPEELRLVLYKRMD